MIVTNIIFIFDYLYLIFNLLSDWQIRKNYSYLFIFYFYMQLQMNFIIFVFIDLFWRIDPFFMIFFIMELVNLLWVNFYFMFENYMILILVYFMDLLNIYFMLLIFSFRNSLCCKGVGIKYFYFVAHLSIHTLHYYFQQLFQHFYFVDFDYSYYYYQMKLLSNAFEFARIVLQEDIFEGLLQNLIEAIDWE